MRLDLCVGLAMILAAGCVRTGDHTRDSATGHPAGGVRTEARADTVRGIVEVTGSEPATTLRIRTAAAGGFVHPVGDAAPPLQSLEGLEVWVSGTLNASGDLWVERFAVRALGATPARDGILEVEDGAYRLRGYEGAVTSVIAPSAELRRHVGARVWTSGDPSRAPEAFGVIGPIAR